MRLIFRPQLKRVKYLRLSRRTICLLNALDHFFHSQKVPHAGMLVGWIGVCLFSIAHGALVVKRRVIATALCLATNSAKAASVIQV